MVYDKGELCRGRRREMGTSMKERLKKFIGLPLIVVMFAVILFIGFQNGELEGAAAALREMRPFCILGCVVCFAGYLTADALGIHSALRCQGVRIRFRDTFLVTLRGQYYYYITPSASGGQPMQVYYLRKMGVPAGVGTSALVCHFAAFQSMLAVLMTLFMIPFHGYILQNIGPNLPLLVLGYLINVFVVAMVLLVSFSPRLVRMVLDRAVRLGTRLHLVKKPEQTEARLLRAATLFHDSMERIRSHPAEIFRQLLLGGLQQLLLMSVLYIIYIGLGYDVDTLPHLISMALAQYISASYVPIPGASGAQEGVFSLFFRQIFPGGSCFAAMMIWRCTTFYLPLVVSAASILIYSLHGGKTKAETEAEARAGQQQG